MKLTLLCLVRFVVICLIIIPISGIEIDAGETNGELSIEFRGVELGPREGYSAMVLEIGPPDARTEKTFHVADKAFVTKSNMVELEIDRGAGGVAAFKAILDEEGRERLREYTSQYQAEFINGRPVGGGYVGIMVNGHLRNVTMVTAEIKIGQFQFIHGLTQEEVAAIINEFYPVESASA